MPLSKRSRLSVVFSLFALLAIISGLLITGVIQRSSAGDRTHALVLGIEKGNGFLEGGGFSKIEGFHIPALEGIRSIAAFKFAANSRATSALFARNTGSPNPPSFPARPTFDV